MSKANWIQIEKSAALKMDMNITYLNGATGLSIVI